MAENCNECSIAWIRGGEYAEVSAYSGSKLKGRVLKLSEQFPDDVKILATNKDGSIFARVPAKYVKLRAPKILMETMNFLRKITTTWKKKSQMC